MSFFTWVLIFLGVMFASGVLIAFANAHLKKELTAKLKSLHPNANIHADSDGTYIVVDTVGKTIIVGQDRHTVRSGEVAKPFECTCTYDQIAQVEINKDGDTLTSTNRGSQAMGATLGVVAFGGVGAVIGGLSGSSTSRATVRRISLRLIIDDPNFPFHDITFFDTEDKNGVEMNGFTGLPARQAMERIQEIHALVVGAIRSADKEAALAHKLVPNAPTLNVVSQIKELWQLHETGAITNAEFERQKKSLLA